MRRWVTFVLLGLSWASLSICRESNGGPVAPERFRLENGLTVLVRPVRGAGNVALVVLYGVGGDHDPEGRSGLAHLVEHVYVTAAAGKAAARTADDYFRRYRLGCNAQTSDRYTVVATVFPGAELGDELRDAAARMGDLHVTAADLDRERPRLIEEVENMFGRFPPLGALNNARELVRPTPMGGRRGGVPAHVQAITPDEVRAHWERLYKPRNATLVLVGDVDPAAARRAVTEHFTAIAAGETAPAPREPGAPRLGAVRELTAKSPWSGAEACLAYAPPQPGSDLYVPYLVVVARLLADMSALGAGPGRSPIYCPILDDSSVLGVSAPAKRGETAPQVFARLEVFVARVAGAKLGKDDVASARQAFGFHLGTDDLPDAALAQNTYGVAFSLARREQLGIDPARLDRAFDAVTDRDLRRVVDEVLSPNRHSGAFVSPEK